MKLSEEERLAMIRQFKILEKMYPWEATFYAGQRMAVEAGDLPYFGRTESSEECEISDEDSQEVRAIFNMYKALAHAYSNLEDQSGIDAGKLRFSGFDSKSEADQYSYTNSCLLDCGLFEELSYGIDEPDYDSHTPMLVTYRRMLRKWNQCGSNKATVLTKQQIQEILDA